MKIVIVGDGKVGRSLTEQLSREGHDVVIIDKNSKVVDEVVNNLDVLGITGNGASYSVQKEADVEHADLLIAATSSDELNILCCLVAKKAGAKATIARVRNPDYTEQLTFMGNELGLSMSINPELAAANEIFRILRSPSTVKMDSFSRGRIELVGLKVQEGCRLEDMPLNQLPKKIPEKVLVCAVQRGEQVFIPGGDFILQAGDVIHVTGTPKAIYAFIKSVGLLKDDIKTVMIVGGGKIAHYLSLQLLALGVRVKIIELDAVRCEELSECLPHALIINGDGTSQEVLEEEGIDYVDALVALTGIDEENIIISMFANSRKVDKVVTKVNRQSFINMIGSMGIDSVVSPKELTTALITRYVRAMQNSIGSNVINLHRIVENKVEALEFRVGKDSRCIGIPLRSLKLKPDLLISSIMREGVPIFPTGDDVILAGDSVVVVVMNQFFSDLDDILL